MVIFYKDKYTQTFGAQKRATWSKKGFRTTGLEHFVKICVAVKLFLKQNGTELLTL